MIHGRKAAEVLRTGPWREFWDGAAIMMDNAFVAVGLLPLSTEPAQPLQKRPVKNHQHMLRPQHALLPAGLLEQEYLVQTRTAMVNQNYHLVKADLTSITSLWAYR